MIGKLAAMLSSDCNNTQLIVRRRVCGGEGDEGKGGREGGRRRGEKEKEEREGGGEGERRRRKGREEERGKGGGGEGKRKGEGEGKGRKKGGEKRVEGRERILTYRDLELALVFKLGLSWELHLPRKQQR